MFTSFRLPISFLELLELLLQSVDLFLSFLGI